VAAPTLRPTAYRDTHFNDLVVNSTGVGVGVVRVAREGPKKSLNTNAANARSAGAGLSMVDGDDGGGVAGLSLADGDGGEAIAGLALVGPDANSAFDRAFAEERRLAESHDADVRALRRARAKVKTPRPYSLNPSPD
jgi:hypothetical protein